MAGRTFAMGFDAFTYHGGALEVARRLAPDAPTPWIDLSTGINPYAYPLPDLAAEVWTRLPDSESLAELEAAAAARYRASAASVVAGPGSQALIHALSRISAARRGRRLGPTYGGHAAAFAAAGVLFEHAASLDAMDDLDVAIVVNPNNPDGRITRRADLLELHERLAPRGGMLIVDEAFADFDGAEKASSRRCPRAAPSSCAPSARPTGWRGFASVLPRFPGYCGMPCAPPLGPGRSAVRRSRSALARSPIRIGWRQRAPDLARTKRGSTPSWTRPAGASSAVRACFASPRAKMQARLSSACSWRAFSRAPSRARPTGCGLAFQAERRRGDGSRRRSEGQSLPNDLDPTGRSAPLAFPRAPHKRRACPFASPEFSRFPPARRFCRR